MELINELVLPFGIPTKHSKIVFNKDNFNFDQLNKKISDNMCFGLLVQKQDDIFNISLSKVSHIISNIYIKDDGIYCDIKILDTNGGHILKSLIEKKVKISFRSNIRPCVTLNSNDDKYNFQDINAYNMEDDYFDLVSYYRLKKIMKLMHELTTTINKNIS